MRIPNLRDWMLPILILAFVGMAVSLLRPLFNVTTRWLVLGLVIVYLMFSGGLGRPQRTLFGFFTLVFAAWALGTSMWSEVPLLSFMKAVAFILIAFFGMALGQMWVRQHPLQDSLKYLLPLTVVALLAGVFGRYSASAVVSSGVTTMYQGLVYGSNMFGSMLAMCLTFLLWQTYRFWKNSRQRTLWLMLSGIGLFYLFAASSRGAILVVLCTVLGLFLSLGMKRKVHFLVLLLVVVLGGFMLAPEQLEQFKMQYIYKQATQEQGVLYTRIDIWQESYEQAEKGGWIGGGYGVTIGDVNFEGGLTSVGYGREKGNLQLAIVEETGLVGLMIHLVSLVALFARLGRVALRLPKGPEKVLLSIVTGTLVGMIIQSVFEAWWVAPASPESVYFWTLAGVALGLAEATGRKSPSRALQLDNSYGDRGVPLRSGR